MNKWPKTTHQFKTTPIYNNVDYGTNNYSVHNDTVHSAGVTDDKNTGFPKYGCSEPHGAVNSSGTYNNVPTRTIGAPKYATTGGITDANKNNDSDVWDIMIIHIYQAISKAQWPSLDTIDLFKREDAEAERVVVKNVNEDI